jgi:hypothetical protein
LTLYKALGGGWNGEDEPEAAKLLHKDKNAAPVKAVAETAPAK